jgi:hypothetical protein
MQRAVRKHWQGAADRSRKPRRPKEFGFLNPWPYALEIGSAFAQFGVLPSAGGWGDQFEADKHDIAEYMRGLSYYQWKAYQKEDKGNPKPVEPQAFPDWQDYTQ